MIYLPDGVQDFLPEEYEFKRNIEDKFREVFKSFGYKEIMPPTFEYSENFSHLFDENSMYRFFDKKGNILALRPDVTAQIARIVSTKLEGRYPLKLCYVANVYRYEDTQVGKMREFTQAGVELIGTNHEESDAEVIALSIEALKSTGLKDFKIDIGHAEVFGSIVRNLNLENEDVNLLRELLEQKNQSAIEDFIKQKEIKKEEAKLLQELPLLFGGKEILEKLKKENFKETEGVLEYLDRVYKILEDFGMKEYISFDLGMVQNLNYYTGIIFRGFVKGLGYAICTGGRYDKLLKIYGKDLPATGFAISVERVMLALQRQSKGEWVKPRRVLVRYKEEERRRAYEKANVLRKEGNVVEMYTFGRCENIDLKSFDEVVNVGE